MPVRKLSIVAPAIELIFQDKRVVWFVVRTTNNADGCIGSEQVFVVFDQRCLIAFYIHFYKKAIRIRIFQTTHQRNFLRRIPIRHPLINQLNFVPIRLKRSL